MKKRIISAVAMMALLFGPICLQTAKSQILILPPVEEEIIDDEGEGGELDDPGLDPEDPNPEDPKPGITIDFYAPLGGEIFVLGCLGGAYLLGKRRRKE